MSITKITDPSAVPAAVADYEAQNNLIQSALTGLAKITLSNYDNDSAPAVKVGSVFNVGGTTYGVSTADETPSGYSGIAVSTTFYLYFDAGTEAFIYSATAPVWNDAYQGWYNSDDRAFFSMYKDSGGTLYEGKTKLQDQNNIIIGNIETLDSGTSWTVPANIYKLKATIIGGGGGGGGSRAGGSSGGTTTFNSISASGGSGGKQGDISADANDTPNGLSAGNGGVGGVEYESMQTTGSSGIGGIMKIVLFNVTPLSSISYAIGSGGSGGSSYVDGGDGGNGQIILEY